MGMSVGGLGSSPFGLSASALRVGLLEIRPIEQIETIKRWGIRFRRISRGLEPSGPIESVEEHVAFVNRAVVDNIVIPNRFNGDAIVDYLNKRSISFLRQEKDLQQQIEKLHAARNRREGLGALYSFIVFMQERNKALEGSYLKVQARRFLSSDFPLSFFSDYVVFEDTWDNYLALIAKIVGRHDKLSQLPRARSEYRIYSRVVFDLKRALSPFIDQMDLCLFRRVSLNTYLDVCNANTLEEISKHERASMGRLDAAEFQRLYDDFRMANRDALRLFMKQDLQPFEAPLGSDESTRLLKGVLMTYAAG
jgi:hypothetical protein